MLVKNFDNKEIPWPIIHNQTETKIVVPLIENYKFEDMWYLDTSQAMPIFETQADIMIKNNSKGIVDVGCRHGPINQILHDKGYVNYSYFGFDTSKEPIDIANTRWANYDNISYVNANWHNEQDITVNFTVDTIIFSGVLLYERQNHFLLFQKLINFYKPKFAIIQEPYHTQKYWDDKLQLFTITNDMQLYKTQFKRYTEIIVDCDIFSGRRLIAEVEI